MTDPAAAAAASGDPFGQELAEAFRRRRPQGGIVWNFDVAFARMEEELATSEPDPLAASGASGGGGDAPGTAPAGGRGRRLRGAAERLIWSRLERRVAWRAGEVAAETTERVLREGLVRTGLAQGVEALRFLALRVGTLEDAAGRRRSPVATIESELPPPSLDGWAAPVAEALGAGARGPVLHGECGDGLLVEQLRAAGFEARGVEPRAPLAWEASRRPVPVMLGGVGEGLRAADPASLGGVVLSGVVDRLAVEDLVEITAAAVDRTAPGGVVVVIGSDPDKAVSGWPAVARDLLPGRPLHPETWALLLARAGLSGVARLAGSPGAAGCAVAGRRDR